MVTILDGSRVLGVGVDWMTVTAQEVTVCEQLLKLGEAIRTSREVCGFFSRRQGFQGYMGYGVDGCFIGTRADGVCLRVSGETAHHRAGDIARIPANITRIDLQATVAAPDVTKDYAHELIEAVRADTAGTVGSHKCHTQYIDSGDNGTSAYIGQRAAAFYGRVYDKARESGGKYAAGTWRIEAESKRRLAGAVWRELCERDVRREVIAGLLAAQFRKRGIRVVLPDAVVLDEPQVPRVASDVERRLRWLRLVVQPVVKRLHDAGYSVEAAEALYGWLMPEQD